MTTGEFISELDSEYGWRFEEIRNLKNLIANEPFPDRRDELRKSLVLVLYAHFEGYCVFCLRHYLNAINSENIECSRAEYSVLAGALETAFNAMQTGDKKCKIFTKPLPADKRLHRHWRRRHFLEELNKLMANKVTIRDDVIDAESNLKPEVLARNLFILGLDHTFVESKADTISELLNRRNRIAHGVDRRAVVERDYNRFETAVFSICLRLRLFLEESHQYSSYERPQPEFAI